MDRFSARLSAADALRANEEHVRRFAPRLARESRGSAPKCEVEFDLSGSPQVATGKHRGLSRPVWIFVAVALVVGFLAWPEKESPEYDGKSLEQWFREACMVRGNDLGPSWKLAEAVKAIGQPAVPFLIRKTRYRDSFISATWGRFTSTFPTLANRFDPPILREYSVRASAYGALEQMGPLAKDAVPDLMKVLRLPANTPALEDHLLRAVIVLGAIGPDAESAVPDLIHVATNSSHPQWNVELAESGLWTLGQIGPRGVGAVSALTDVIASRSGRLRVAAAIAFHKIDRQTEMVMQVLKEAIEGTDVEAAIASARGFLEIDVPDQVALPLLITALNRPEAKVQLFAASALGSRAKAAGDAVPRLIELFLAEDSIAHGSARRTLAKIEPPTGETIHAMAAYVADAGRRALDRAEAAQALGEFRSNAAAAVPALVSALEDGDPLLRLDASFALWQIEPARVEQTLAILIENLRGSNPFHAYRAAIRLGEMGFAAKSAIPDLEQALQRRYEWDAAHDVVHSALKEVKRQSNERR